MAASAIAIERSVSTASKPIDEIRKSCEEIAHTEPGDTQKMASVLLQMSLNYYEDVRTQAQQSFKSALVAAAVGTCFLVAAANAHGAGQWR